LRGPFGVYSATPPALSDKDQEQLQLNSDGSLKVGGAGQGLIVSGQTPPLVTAQMARPGNVTQYSIGDAIANSMTAASVVPTAFTHCRVAFGFGLSRSAGSKDGATVVGGNGALALPIGAVDTIDFGRDTNGLNDTLESVAYHKGQQSDAFILRIGR
jgi:hypothetical protein